VDTATFVDGIGRRIRIPDATGEDVETLRLCRELSEASSTEPALIDRAERLAGFAHETFAQVRRVERQRGPLGGLSVVSAAVPGLRLSEILALSQRQWKSADVEAALYLLEQIASAMAALHRHSREFSHGALGPERVVVRPDGHPVIVEHVLAPAIGRLQMSRSALWAQFRIPSPAVAGAARLDQMTDIMQLGMVGLALLLGRPIRKEDFPQKLQDLLAEAAAPGAPGPQPALARSLHVWILRTLQFETRAAFRTMNDAAAALESLVAAQPRHKVSAASVVAWVAACHAPGEGAPPPTGLAGAASGVAVASPNDGRVARPAESVREASAAPPVASTTAAEAVARAVDPTLTFRRARGAEATVLPHRGTTARRSALSWPAQRSTAASRRDARRAGEHAAPDAAFDVVRSVSTVVKSSVRKLSALDWPKVRRGLAVVIVAAALGGVFGVTYLGARGYLGFPSFIESRGTLVIESQPSGVELFVDGFPSGHTPATLELKAGAHTLALRAGRRTTLLPVTVVSGARRVERVEIRQSPKKPQVAARPAVPPRAQVAATSAASSLPASQPAASGGRRP
jgi:hypothetical protein